MNISYRPAKPEDLEEGERVCFQAGNELRLRHGGRAAPAPPSIAFPQFCQAERAGEMSDQERNVLADKLADLAMSTLHRAQRLAAVARKLRPPP